ncbi:hypothetical protein [Bacteroides sp.]|uniref:hypothetical protein n=1 Tax=Bacteroides sp. TaxID=29523 RepID=UPI00260B6A1F|nr:hypothetical protein [Bacteroides sp.]MDD3040548.1 hypothetical protein [Bacteroides sp.]
MTYLTDEEREEFARLFEKVRTALMEVQQFENPIVAIGMGKFDSITVVTEKRLDDDEDGGWSSYSYNTCQVHEALIGYDHWRAKTHQERLARKKIYDDLHKEFGNSIIQQIRRILHI